LVLQRHPNLNVIHIAEGWLDTIVFCNDLRTSGLETTTYMWKLEINLSS